MKTHYIVQRTGKALFFPAGLHGDLVSHLLKGLTKTGIGTEGGEKLNTAMSKKPLRGRGLFSLLKWRLSWLIFMHG